MAHWDTSALLKLYLAEPDSLVFERLASSSPAIQTAFIARHEAHTAFVRRESEGALSPGEAAKLCKAFLDDILAQNVAEVLPSAALEGELDALLRQCLFASPPLLVRTNDALHLAAARLSGETEFVTADLRQRAAALHVGLKVLP